MELQLNGGAHTLKILFDLQVRKAKDPNPFYSLKVIGSDCILLRPLVLIVLRAVQLDGQSGRMAVKIHDIWAKGPLPEKLNGLCSQEIIPQMVFFLCGFFAQFLGTDTHWYFLLHIVALPLIRPSGPTGAPSPRGRLIFYSFSRISLRFCSYSSWVMRRWS